MQTSRGTPRFAVSYGEAKASGVSFRKAQTLTNHKSVSYKSQS
jgi:hypothetical protein